MYKNVNRIISKKIKALKKACERYQNHFEEEKNKKRQYAHERYRNLSEKKKKRSVNMAMNDIKFFYRIKKNEG